MRARRCAAGAGGSLEANFPALISQNHEPRTTNHESRISDRRNQLGLQINLLTEQANTQMIQMRLSRKN